MSHLSLVFITKTDPKMPKNILPQKSLSKKQCPKCYFFLFLLPTTKKHGLTFILNTTKTCIKAIIHSSSCGKYNSHEFLIRNISENHIFFFVWWLTTVSKTIRTSMFLAVPSWISHNWWSGSSYQYIHEAPNVGLEDMDSPFMRGQQGSLNGTHIESL